MEFDVVFLIGMTEGTFTDYRAKGRSLEEEHEALLLRSRVPRDFFTSRIQKQE